MIKKRIGSLLPDAMVILSLLILESYRRLPAELYSATIIDRNSGKFASRGY
ncbi:hypothetical protein [Endozoicomonas sp. SCSIO W0465]|uniref:hypothetical protein n=1 Tax=Endozoicomonas sp. SCSIO W0465 TaxID=2918516 RepID=UPI002075C2B5|nr:hypothetical protein [Endozoicomonas sp. SCSIO W0465]USE37539.1 hypothetical protein MJO57_04815 [Endozoicomonas sp. SCSIO W0465]